MSSPCRWNSAVSALAAVAALAAVPARAETINVSASVDFTGPFADVMPSWHSGHRAFVAWWNDTVGKKLGVKVDLKVHDMRYDAGTVARTWPSVLSGDRPAVFLGMGTPDLVSLMKRLPGDKVPMLMPTALVSQVWSANGWHFSFRPTYSHEFAALFAHVQENLPGKRALRIATVSTQGRPGYEDQVKGIVKLAESYPARFVIAAQEWVDDNPIDVTGNVSRIVEKKADVIMIGATTAQVVAVAKALKQLGAKIPIATSSHNGLTEVAKAMPLSELEGSMSVFAFAPYNQAGLQARAIYEKYHSGPGTWGIVAAQAAAQTILALRAIEQAIATVGKGKVTGEAVYRALLGKTYRESDMLGMTPDLKFDASQPFPSGTPRAKALVVRKGELVPMSEGWLTTPNMDRW